MKDKYYIQIVLTNQKTINLCLETKYAPKTVEHFVELVKENKLDGAIFHRVIANFMIQTGGYIVEDMTLKEIDNVSTVEGEFASNGHHENTLHHELGVISMARTNVKNSATSQFFICAADCPWLDGEYAAFGKTIDEESNQAVLEISKMKTGYLSDAFADFPTELIGIETIKLLDK